MTSGIEERILTRIKELKKGKKKYDGPTEGKYSPYAHHYWRSVPIIIEEFKKIIK